MTPHSVTIRAWTSSDLDSLHRLNSPAMTEHLGGPESEAKVIDRLARYVAASGDTQIFVIEADASLPAGGIGYWPREWQGSLRYEMGWSVLPEHQGEGIATADVAFPSRPHGLSETICATGDVGLLGDRAGPISGSNEEVPSVSTRSSVRAQRNSG